MRGKNLYLKLAERYGDVRVARRRLTGSAVIGRAAPHPCRADPGRRSIGDPARIARLIIHSCFGVSERRTQKSGLTITTAELSREKERARTQPDDDSAEENERAYR